MELRSADISETLKAFIAIVAMMAVMSMLVRLKWERQARLGINRSKELDDGTCQMA
jgi:hypothetical protein